MSVESKKKACGYSKTQNTCSNCASFTSDLVLPLWMVNNNMKYDQHDQYTVERHGVEKNLRCGKHGFAVQKTATCRDWQLRDSP